MTGCKDIPKPVAAFDSGHDVVDHGLALGVDDLSLFFEAADIFAIGGVVGHQWTV